MPTASRLLRWFVAAAFGGALALTLVFAVRLALGAFYWSDPAHRNQRIEGWMPLGYIARSWEVPPAELLDIAGIDAPARRQRSLDSIARDEGIPLARLIERIERGLVARRGVADD